MSKGLSLYKLRVEMGKMHITFFPSIVQLHIVTTSQRTSGGVLFTAINQEIGGHYSLIMPKKI